MADREGRCELPIAPGQVYIEVEYDYEYKAKDKLVTIKQGECYMLVRKTNGDWWQVRKDENTKPFYVPAQYVREVRKALMPPPKPLNLGGPAKPKPTVLDIRRSNENLNKQPEMSSFGRPSPGPLTPPALPRDANQNPSSPGHGKGVPDPFPNNNNACSTLPRSRAESPTPRALEQNRSPAQGRRAALDLDLDRPHCDSAGEGSEKLRNDSESGDELSSSSTEHLQTASPTGQGRPESPVYTNLQELKISQSSLPPQPSSSPLQVQGEWETHRDGSGRHFYYNRATQERSWKPPRARDASSSSSSRGESHTPGEAEWIKHVDEQGRPYYYSADGSRSEWELPKYNLSPPKPGDALKSRSLDRKQEPIVLTKWRHSTYVLDTNDKPSEKCGVLNVTKITENGKKVRKNWTSSWTVLQGYSLLFAKSQGGGTSWFGSQSKPEFTVDLRGGSVDWASKDKSSKKHVIELKTRQGTELLIQSENDGIINEWFKALVETISAHAWESDEAIEEDMPESPVTEKHDKEKDHRDSKKGRAMKNSTSMDSSDQKKTRVKLKKFLTRRPTLQAVRDKGYIKDQVFGCSLTSLCHRENTTVPKFVKMCIDHVENTGLNVDGLYRVSGNLAVIQKLRFAVNHDEKVNLEDGKWEDIHVTTGALKMFFRELPEPLFTYGSFDDFVSAIKCPDYNQRVHLIKDLIKQLPKPNQDTMQVLFKHLRKVIDHGEVNRMTTQSVAIVFGPTLLRPETETGNMAVHMVYQNQIVDLILTEYEGIFGR
ncbi:rho GTPase-activating protein 12-like isoform X8 [Megalops cyprinoides]|uniref:rho GTPase-activating protein 12-like isoform X8 n=1 Tax=Megalops cyprinoides TaxID=118141 RepID=UPI001863DB83|nr:rho GTPase-activating protein 12-like isoform X8 [Megalops cyprinoides]